MSGSKQWPEPHGSASWVPPRALEHGSGCQLVRSFAAYPTVAGTVNYERAAQADSAKPTLAQMKIRRVTRRNSSQHRNAYRVEAANTAATAHGTLSTTHASATSCHRLTGLPVR